MNRSSNTRIQLVLAAALVAAACVQAPPESAPSARDQLLDQAFSLVESDPRRAADLFADAGPGPTLETARMESWADCLGRLSPPSSAWQRYLDHAPPPRLAARARLRLIEALIDESDFIAAEAERMSLPDSLGPAADELLLDAPDPALRRAAAQRLAVASPRRLVSHDTKLDKEIAAGLSPEQLLERSRAWRRTNSPSRAAAELRRQKWRGDIEQERRRELARAELDAGSPRRALRSLPDGRDAHAADHSLRARAHRNRAWNLYPERRAGAVFHDCLNAAGRALAMPSETSTRYAALVLELECATETGRLDTAFSSWQSLERENWNGSRRPWLGRRLAVAIAVNGSRLERALEIAAAIPSQARCIRYWVADAASSDEDLSELAAAPVPDLYARWSQERLSGGARSFHPAAPVSAAPPPPSVQRLMDSGAHLEAARQWRRIRLARKPTPEEALAGAAYAVTVGRQNDSIQWLRSGFPELGTVDMASAPENVIRTYLPIRWRDALLAASTEFGIDPWLVAGVARQESTFSAHAVSPRNAVGVLQLLSSTATPHARALGLGTPPDLHDPELNIRLGARELAYLLRRFGAVEPALAAYNGGETRVRGWWRQQPDHQLFTEEIPIPETYNYVRRVVYLSEAYRLLYADPRR